MTRSRLFALAGGLLMAAGTPPWGFWPLAFVGVALVDRALADRTGDDGPAGDRRAAVERWRATWGDRFRVSWIAWAALFFPSLFWMRALTAPGYVIACVAYAAFLAVGTSLAPIGRTRWLALPAGVVVAEWVRWRWPFGGVPLSNLAIGQVAGPLAPVLRVGGAILVVLVTVVVGLALSAATARRLRAAGGLAAATLVVLLVSLVAPDGTGTGRFLDVAVVQGGGPQGTRAVDTEPGIVLERHLAASEALEGDFDLLLWPEDVVDVVRIDGSPEEKALMALAREHDAVFVAGVIEDEGPDQFRNWAIAYGSDGDEVGRYEKVERVPFGEWVPMRALLAKVAGDALPARDAVIGEGPAVIDTAAGRLGVSISWEIFFGERSRDALANGAEVLLNPTNGASFDGTQVQTQQVASSRMRAIENGRWVLQAAPTGFSAVVSPSGEVRQRTAVSERRILYDTIELRSGRTWYSRYGDLPTMVLALGLLGAAWFLETRRPAD